MPLDAPRFPVGHFPRFVEGSGEPADPGSDESAS